MDINEVVSRITEDLEYLKQFTSTPGEGCTRLPFTPEARSAVDYLKKIMTDAGLDVREDEAGNVFGTIEGEEKELPCIMMGSHYDSVTNGGDYDGIAGIISAIEVARLMKENNKKPKHTYVVAGFCDEEGMRFGTGYFGSKAMLGQLDVEYCKHYTDKNGVSVYDAMKEYGLDPEKIEGAKWNIDKIGSFIETHIEQGPVLDSTGIELGLVEWIVGIQRFMFTVHGRSDHAGTTPMDMRKDAVDAATKVISKIPDWAREKADGTVATVGYIKTIPGGMNIVAQDVEFTVDIRSKNNDNIIDIVNKIKEALKKEVGEFDGSYDSDTKLVITPVKLSEDMLDVLEESCKERSYTYKRMLSGAGHDALAIGQILPTVMLFVPSKDGRSHCPIEFSKYSDFGKSILVAYDLVQTLDKKESE
ncbi:M20 family metallo-hydrolase [Clostridium sp. E02]|uniref:M20 family metallo-hydrolase n=1 Tax=Clostridium sp. E02 TaxID=2487134 RepID=UPI000F529E6D|nr:M20 family metallo-hydrolase [Clostridium sp. E02]